MKKTTFLICVFLMSIAAQAQKITKKNLDSLWLNVERYQVNDQPRSAWEEVNRIYYFSDEHHLQQDFYKALLYRAQFALLLESDGKIAVINDFRSAIERSEFPMKNILQSMLAEVYAEYYYRYRYKISKISRVVTEEVPEDVRYWDKATFVSEIIKLYDASLDNSKKLKRIAMKDYEQILSGVDTDVYRPTLFDFLAFRAIKFYEKKGYLLPQYFPGDKEKPIALLQPNEAFIRYRFPAADSTSFFKKAVEVYQQLTAFHLKDKDPTALVDATLHRVRYMDEQLDLPSDSLYLQTLKVLSKKYADYPVVTEVDYKIAEKIYHQNKRDKEVTEYILGLCTHAIKTFPDSWGALQCKDLKDVILQRNVELEVDKYLIPEKPALMAVNFRNVDTLYFKAYKISDAAIMQSFFKLKYYWNWLDMNFVANQDLALVKTWEVVLPNPHDYANHTTEEVLPALPHGNYIITASVKENAEFTSDFLAHTYVQVNPFALISVPDSDSFFRRYQLLNRETGKPVLDQKVEVQFYDYEENTHVTSETMVSDSLGMASLATIPTEIKEFFKNDTIDRDLKEIPRVFVGNDTLTFDNYIRTEVNSYEVLRENHRRIELVIDTSYKVRAHIFTDRKIYRPGQTIYFKGIVTVEKEYETRPFIGKMEAKPFAGAWVTVFLEDANLDEIGKKTLQLNEYGSVAGEFTIPKTGITGEYSLYIEECTNCETEFYDTADFDFDDGEIEVYVEEYKRPKFEVTFNTVKESYKVNDSLKIKGTAKAFSGSNVSNAKVVYTIKRGSNVLWMLDNKNRYGANDFLNGETVTDANGNFEIDFVAAPDNVNFKEAIFTYDITVSVTDSNGETQEGESLVRVGYYTTETTVSLNSRLFVMDTNIVTITTKNLNGVKKAAAGTIYLYKIPYPDRAAVPHRWRTTEIQQMSEEEFYTLFPHMLYKDVDRSVDYSKETPITTLPFDTNKKIKYTLPSMDDWEVGDYKVVVKTNDASGIELTDYESFTLLKQGSNQLYDNQLFRLSFSKPIYKRGDTAVVALGTAADSLWVTYTIKKNYDVVTTGVMFLSNEVKKIVVPIDRDAEGYSVQFHYVYYNTFEKGIKEIPLFKSGLDQLFINTVTFRDHIQPGNKETWSFQIDGVKADKVTAEVLATMYDSSLDQFMENKNEVNWSLSDVSLYMLDFDDYYGAYLNVDDFYGFVSSKFNGQLRSHKYARMHYKSYTELYYYGFDFNDQERVYKKRLEELQGGFVDTRGRLTYDKIIRGTVYDMDGLPLVGATVTIKGTAFGAVTDFDGNYSLKVLNTDEIEVGFIGFVTSYKKVAVDTNRLDFTLLLDESQLDEVVVAGYSIKPERRTLLYATEMRKEITGTAVVLGHSADDANDFNYYRGSVYVQNRKIEKVPDSLGVGRAMDEFAGIAGWSDGTKKDSAALRFDAGYISMDSFEGKKLVLIDGVIATEESLKTLDMNDLADFYMIDAAAAKKLYGVEAPDGAIVIITNEAQRKLEADMAKVAVRTNLQETAFFYPQLTTDSNGVVSFSFTSPEALTKWKLQLLAHTKNLQFGYGKWETVTQKELMVVPNLPRFVRTGDTITITTKVSSLTDASADGNALIEFANPIDGAKLEGMIKSQVVQPFHVNPRGTTTVSWQLVIPEGIEALQYKIVAKTDDFSDGEQSIIPVLPRKILVTESVPVTLSGAGEASATLKGLQTTTSETLENYTLTLEVTSDPVWYAIQSLPYLMEFPYECSEQTFSRLYANVVAAKIIDDNPVIKSVFEKWKDSGNLQSKLETNLELKTTLIEATPWLQDAQSEEEQQKRMALLFDLNRIQEETDANVYKLQSMQLYSGGFPWFKGSDYASRFITQHVLQGLGELQHKGLIDNDIIKDIVKDGLRYLDNEIAADFERIKNNEEDIVVKKGKAAGEKYLNEDHISTTQLQYLYIRSLFAADTIKQENVLEAKAYFTTQAKTYWKGASLYDKGLSALIFHQQDTVTTNAIVRSITEYATTTPTEMYWKDSEATYYQTVPELHAFLITVYKEIDTENTNIPLMKSWLLQHKSMHSWGSTKATVRAIDALLETGLKEDNTDVTVTVGSKKVLSNDLVAGSGYSKKVWQGSDITKDMATVTLKTTEQKQLVTGALHWQYFEDIAKVKATDDAVVSVEKELLVKTTNTKGKEEWVPVAKGSVHLGDIVRVRLVLKVDKNVGYVHVKDLRASGLEPVDVMSEYKLLSTMYYYQSTRDVATNFFFEQLVKGVHVLEYDLRVSNVGSFSSGVCTIQSMYAPEIGGHSNSKKLVILGE